MTRQELIALIEKSAAMPPFVKALAGVYVMTISDQRVAEIGETVKQVSAAIDRGDWETVTKVAKGAGLPEAYMTYARNILDAAKPHHPAG